MVVVVMAEANAGLLLLALILGFSTDCSGVSASAPALWVKDVLLVPDFFAQLRQTAASHLDGTGCW
jgi:hypothetical protein